MSIYLWHGISAPLEGTACLCLLASLNSEFNRPNSLLSATDLQSPAAPFIACSYFHLRLFIRSLEALIGPAAFFAPPSRRRTLQYEEIGDVSLVSPLTVTALAQ
ncbi:hypothetical protein MNEG_12101, partial [Monoraphidium neglectum]